ncbi:OmpA family protein [Xanthovirga aplysinae]|uniref:OmpA family protein n=1 Tax=Xanthovirga aplysinae TaxID=2529853 RepID=UPI0012BCE019|nr:OmpA family protein [Xanthovirga aplysinae]MTI30190.1 tetratricopeptide repeat protein [Xanthovirga aplysinae]
MGNTHKIPWHLFIILLAFISSCSSAYKKASSKFESAEYNVAINHYKKILEKGDNPAAANYFIAECYRLSNRLDEAAPYYKAAIENGSVEEGAQFFYGIALKIQGNYEGAKEQLEDYLANGTDQSLINLTETELSTLNTIDLLDKNKSYYEIENLGDLSTSGAEYSPVYQEGEVFFTSNREGGKIYNGTGTPFTKLYKAKVKKNSIDPLSIEPLEELINDPTVNVGSAAFSRSGQVMVFAKGNSGKKKGTKEVNLFISRQKNGDWTEPSLMGINDPNAWDSSPAFSRDGRTLYFASNREGGFGGIDLYSAKMDANGRWGNVKNMGNKINTSGDEMFPTVSNDGKLYFSSSGHPGYGGLDLFEAVRKDGDISVKNLGVPINSSKDDFGITFIDPMHGFFTSNRESGNGDDDIYTFVNNSPDIKIINYYLIGTTVTTNDEGVQKILPNAGIRFLGPDGNLITRTISDSEGKFRFRVDGDTDYKIIGEKKNYFTTRVDFTTVGRSIPKDQLTKLVTNVTFETVVNLDQIVLNKAIVLENIYYDFDKSDIRTDAALELDKLVNLLKDNVDIKIELSSHTDNRGGDEYNQELSQRRAESAVAYIIASGISEERITARGYGKSQPIVPNAETEEEHEMNRRTQFKVTEYNQELEEIPVKEELPEEN